MAEAAGLALGVLGVAALFSTCIEAFDIVLSAKECSEEYKQLSALVGLQRVRFQIWGEGVGLPSGRSANELKIPYNTQLDLPHIQPCIACALEEIRQLLNSVTAIDGRYGVKAIAEPEGKITTLSGTHIFQKSFDRLRKRIQKGQKDKSILKVTRWALHDAKQFEKTISRLTEFTDNLFKITTELKLLQQRYEALRIHEEINSITNRADLELLAKATSMQSGTSIHKTVSDAASKRFSIVAASVRDENADPETRSRPHSNASTNSFHTAKTRPSHQALEALGEEESGTDIADESPPETATLAPESRFASLLDARSCAECDEASLQCSVTNGATSCFNCLENQKECSFDLGGSSALSGDSITASLRSTPQHERLLAESVARSRASPRALTFEAGDTHHGDRMKEIIDNNLDYWIEHSAAFVSQAHRSSSVMKRMFHELKTIHKAKVPFISATPVAGDLGEILASIEGPPETPYEGGIFWILVSASQNTPGRAPILRFHTKIYHPNIDPRSGILCADFEQKWSPAKVSPSLKKHFAVSTALWSERTSPDMWSLLSLLIAIGGLLASPNVNDPLVPHIAQKLVEDPDGFYEIARKWTAEYAKASYNPDGVTLRFPDEPAAAVETGPSNELTPMELEDDLDYSSAAMQEYLRSKYDDKFDDEWKTCSSSSRHSSVPTWASNSITTTISSELEPRTFASDAQEGRFEVITDSLLLRDAEQSHLRQLIGEHLSKIEQWRMVREVRLALDKPLYRTASLARWDVTGSLTNSQIRSLIRESASRLYDPDATERLRQYFNTLKASFAEKDSSKSVTTESNESSHLTSVTSNEGPGCKSAAETKSRDDNVYADRPLLYAPYKHGLGAHYPLSRTPYSSASPYESHGFYKQEPGPSPRYRSARSFQNPTQGSSQVFSPRYTSAGYYSTAANLNGKQSSWSAPRHQTRPRNSHAYRVCYGDSEDEYEYIDYLVDGEIYRVLARSTKDSSYYSHTPLEESSLSRRRRQSSNIPQRPTTARPTTSAKKPPPGQKATEADARKHRIPPGYSLKNWDPTEEPIMLLGSVFDANSLGKWIFDWTVYHHGPASPFTDMALELWLLLIQLSGKIKRAEECIPRIRMEENREMVEDFIDSGERLMDKLKKLLKSCEAPMRRAAKKTSGNQVGKNAGLSLWIRYLAGIESWKILKSSWLVSDFGTFVSMLIARIS